MNFSMRRVNAIFQKDFKDLLRNPAVSISALIPLMLAFLYSKMELVTIFSSYMIINLTMVMVGVLLQCNLIAEEKEKNTLRGLMLSPASIPEILAGKSLLSASTTLLVVVAGSFLTSYKPENIIIIAIAIILTTFFFIGLGTLLGLIAKSVMEASVLIMPFMFIFGFGSVSREFTGQYPILKLLNYTPNTQLLILAERIEEGAGLIGVASNLGIIVLWIIVITYLTIGVFKKRMVD